MVETLASLNGISESGRAAFKARLRKLQGAGVPGEANPGKGRRVEYSVPLLIEVTIAVELLQCGWSPHEAASLIKAHRSHLLLASLASLVDPQPDLLVPLLLIRPQALREFSQNAEEAGGPIGAVEFLSREGVAALFNVPVSASPAQWKLWRASVIDLPVVVRALIMSISLQGYRFDDVVAAFRAEASLRDRDLWLFSDEVVDGTP
ncbi:MAG: hypothetical protein ABS38_12795 [Acidovorax sp. SCN 68-22]|nr:MAG: hypothetical protein ABS38_12795 [Acidovorax sp. SCN 68-22]